MENNKKIIRIVVLSNLLTVLLVVFILTAFFQFTEIRALNLSNDLSGLPNDPDITGFLSEHIHSGESVVVPVVERANPAVVSIMVTRDVPRFRTEERIERFDPFDFIVPDQIEDGSQEVEVGGGSGFFTSSDGLIVTNRHVVANEDDTYTVFTSDGQEFPAEVVARDSFFDLAVLRVEGDNFPYLSFGDSEDLNLGETVIAIGTPLGEFRNSVSVGVISGLSRTIVAGDSRGYAHLLEEVIQTDAAINVGNSGGPLLNTKGEVVGINVARTLRGESIGFALPASMARGVVQSVKEYGEIIFPYLGIRYIPVDRRVQSERGLPVDHGVLIVSGEAEGDRSVMLDSPAERAGLREGDIILSLNGNTLTPGELSLGFLLRQRQIGDIVTLRVLRDGEEMEVEVTLDRAPENF